MRFPGAGAAKAVNDAGHPTKGMSSARWDKTSSMISRKAFALKGFMRYPSAPDSHETSASHLAVIMMTSVLEFAGALRICEMSSVPFMGRMSQSEKIR